MSIAVETLENTPVSTGEEDLRQFLSEIRRYPLLTAEEELEIVRVKKFYMRPMTREEAILQMNLLEHNFFAFRDEDNGGSFAVVYRRNDGGYGIIDDAQ